MARLRKHETLSEHKQQETIYKTTSDRARPKLPYLMNILKAFLVGGFICLVGQIILNLFTGVEKTDTESIATTQAGMIALGALLTALGLYDYLGEFSGMGAAVPITGFANTIVAAAIDFRREGWIQGMACKMFMIAGPVLIYGILSGVLVGLVHMIYQGLAS